MDIASSSKSLEPLQKSEISNILLYGITFRPF